MVWTIEYTKKARDELKRLGGQTARRVLDYMDGRVATLENPRDLGQALTGPLGGLWRYRVGDCRVVCDIQDDVLLILVVRVGRRNSPIAVDGTDGHRHNPTQVKNERRDR